MKNPEKLIIATLAIGAAAYLLTRTKKAQKISNKIIKFSNEKVDKLQNEMIDKHTEIKNNLADRLFSFVVDHRQTLANAIAVAIPYLLQNFVNKKM